MAPMPRSKPSRTTYMASMKPTRTNHSVSIQLAPPTRSNGGLLRAISSIRWLRPWRWTLDDFLGHDHQPQHRDDRIHTRETDQAEENVAGRQQGRNTICGVQQSVDYPWLAPELSREPARRVGDERKWRRQQQQP